MIGKAKNFKFILLSFIVGVAAASFGKRWQFFYILIPLVFLALILFYLLKKQKEGGQKSFIRKGIILFFCLIAIGVGLIRYSFSQHKFNSQDVDFYNNKGKAQIILRIRNMPEEGIKSVSAVGEAMNIADVKNKGNQMKIHGKVALTLPLYAKVNYGDIIKTECSLREPVMFDNFDYHEYLATKNIYSTCYVYWFEIIGHKENMFMGSIFRIRGVLKKEIQKYFPPLSGALLEALILGMQKDLPSDARNQFSLTGTSHIISVSGSHLVIMAAIFQWLAISIFKLKRQRAFYFSLISITFFVLLVGAPASAVRSAIMILLVLFAQKIGRPNYSINALILAAASMLFFNPKLLLGDVGFQLSFGSVLGIILCQSYLSEKLKILPPKFGIRDLVATTFAAQIFILPLIVYYFGNLSFIAPLANLLVLPVLPYIMSAGFVFALLVWLPSFLITILVWPLKIILDYVLFILEFLSKIPLAALSIRNFGLIFMICYYIILAIILFYVHSKRKIKLSPSN